MNDTVRAEEGFMPIIRRVLLVFLTVAPLTPAATSAQGTYCSRWNRAAGNPDLQRYAMRENVQKLDGSKVSHACLLGQLDSLVRWTNRVCSDGKLDQEAFAHAFVSEARKRCP